jgi:hypothetical protein
MIYSIEEFKKYKTDGLVLDELNSYLTDIISSIEVEINSLVKKHYGHNESWRTRKNPNFMLKYTNKDKIFLDLNQNINKITNVNYSTISNVLSSLISEFLNTDEGINKLDSIISYIINNILEKAITQDIFAEYYIKCILDIKKEGIDIRKLFILELSKLSVLFFDLLNNADDMNYSNLLTIKTASNITLFRNLGNFFGSLYNEGLLDKNNIFLIFPKFVRKLGDGLEWIPINKILVEQNVMLLTGFICAVQKKLWLVMDRDTQQDFECQLNIVCNHINLPTRLKCHVMDINDKILETKRAKMRELDNQRKSKSNMVQPRISYANIATNINFNNTSTNSTTNSTKNNNKKNNRN